MRRLTVATLALFSSAAFCGVSAAQRPHVATRISAAEHIAHIENGFVPISLDPGAPPVRLDLRKIMEISNVPGLSVAVFDHYRLAWAKGYGVTEADSDTPVTTHTLFQAASISKPVSTIATLQLVEKGKLSLDADVNRYLRSWKVPDNEFTRVQKVTLRRIMTHTAGTTVHGFIGYAAGEPVPTLLQVLQGQKPANTPPITVDFVPGTKQRYSGGGVVIEQQLLMDVTGKSFPEIMREAVIDRLHLKDSTFEQPLSASWARRAASGHDLNGTVIPGKWNIQPEMAVGGLWTTPSNLGRIMAEVALDAAGRSNRLLSPAMAREMLRLQTDSKIETLEGPPMLMGLGWMLGQNGSDRWFEHSGVNRGYVSEALMMRSGRGVVVFANNQAFEAQIVMRYLINNVAKEYGWDYRVTPYTPWPYADTVVLATAKLRGVKAAIRKYRELKALSGKRNSDGSLKVVWTSDPPDYLPNGWDLLGIAQAIGNPSHLQDAIALLKVDVQDYPDFWQGFDILAGLYEDAGDKQHAIENYLKLRELRPDSTDAAARLKRLRTGG
jgi:CubicO group peptidase (beta-lactamase class C family)